MAFLVLRQVENITPAGNDTNSNIRIRLTFGNDMLLEFTNIAVTTPIAPNSVGRMGPDGDSVQLFDSRVSVLGGRSVAISNNIPATIVPTVAGSPRPTTIINYRYYLEDEDIEIAGNYRLTYEVVANNPLDPIAIYLQQVFNLAIQLVQFTIALFTNLFAVFIAPIGRFFGGRGDQFRR